MKERINKIAVITSGGDAPGMNAALRAVARACTYYKIDCLGYYRDCLGDRPDDLGGCLGEHRGCCKS